MMLQRPSALALMLCDQVTFEVGTQKPSLIGVFTGIAVDGFPSGPQRFDAFVALTDGLGTGTLELEVTDANTGNQVYVKRVQLTCPDPLRVINLRLRIRQCSFPTSGEYLFTLLVDGNEIVHRRIRVY
jgi:hypothetical protein